MVDCYNESERYSAWICYLEDKLEFPFSGALCRGKAPPLLPMDNSSGQVAAVSKRTWPTDASMFPIKKDEGGCILLPDPTELCRTTLRVCMS